MNEREFVKHHFQSQRPMTKKEKYEYWKVQVEQYKSKLFPMTSNIDVKRILENMIREE